MDDTGLSVGAALHAWYARTGLISQFKDPFLGPSLYLSPSVLNEATGFNILSQDDKSNIEASVKVLAKDGTVAIVRGRDEFGPRALGHRSLLFSARSNLLANRVQKLLGRDSVMPFAPICRAEQVDSLFEGPFPIPERADRGLTHMTFAVTARPETRDRYPVAVHVDDSSRVQAVTAEKSPFLHTLLTRYEELTGDKMLINTSFNLHGDPIVHDARDALQTFAQSGIDLLVLGDYLVTRDIVQ
jgi:carbamoyltransferase